MKILHFFKTYLPDGFTGVEQVIWSIAEGSAALGAEVSVLALSERPAPSPINIGLHLVYQSKQDFYLASTGFSASVLLKFRQLAKTVDVIHYHFPWPMMDLVDVLIRPKVPTVVTYHSDIVKQERLMPFYRPLMLAFLNRVDRIVATSPNYLQTSEVLHRYQAKTTVIPIGIAVDSQKAMSIDLQSWTARVGQNFFLFVGAPRYYKGLEFLLQAASLTGLPVVIAGADAKTVGALAGSVPPNVKVVGIISDSDKAALLQLCRAFVFPSHLRSEAFGVALLEAARAGRPMISCEIGTGTSFVNIAGVTGLVIPPADVAALAQAMQTLQQDPALAKAMGRAAQQRFLQQFQASQMASAYYALYQSLLGTSRA